MNNLKFLESINASIYKITNIENKASQYYIMIPYVFFDPENSYVENYASGIYVALSNDLLCNDDIIEFINNPDDKYEYFTGLDESEYMINKIYSFSYEYYAMINKYVNIDIDDEDIKNFNRTFMSILTKSYKYNNLETTDYLYKYVIDFYANGMNDDAVILMNTIFNTTLTTSQSACGCSNNLDHCASASSTNTINTGTDLVNVDTATCIEKYKAAMFEWLQKMLSDYNFYCDWMFIPVNDDDQNNDEYIPDTDIIDKLIALIKALLESNYDLSNIGNNSKSSCGNCHSNGKKTTSKCDSLDTSINSNDNGCNNYSILSNYLKVLEWVKNDEVIINKNKIYVYGKQFANIFPLLSF
jgi:hypothetical protein